MTVCVKRSHTTHSRIAPSPSRHDIKRKKEKKNKRGTSKQPTAKMSAITTAKYVLYPCQNRLLLCFFDSFRFVAFRFRPRGGPRFLFCLFLSLCDGGGMSDVIFGTFFHFSLSSSLSPSLPPSCPTLSSCCTSFSAPLLSLLFC